MPTPVVPYKIPDWANPANASVLDSWAQKAIRTLGGLAGVADPVSQVMGLAAAPIDVPAANLAEGLGAKTLKAYHASPHDFDAFDMSKVGSGEGGQMYGHGLYAAENPAVSGRGGQYDRQFTAKNLGKHDLNIAEESVFRGLNQGKSPGEIIADLHQSGAVSNFDEGNAIYERVNKAKAKIYETNIHASPDELLDWDKPLSQQSPKVQEALRALPDADKVLAPNKLLNEIRQAHGQEPEDVPGSLIYSRLVAKMGGRAGHTEGIASQKLKDAGIKGIQYLDQGSRAAGQGTKNFVIFDDKIIEIAKKYGVALPVAAEIARRQQIGSKNGNVESSVAP